MELFKEFFQTWELSPFPAKIWKTVLVLCNQLLPQFSTQIPETSHTDFKHIEVVQILIWNCLTNFFLFFQTWELSRFPAKIWRTVLVLCNHLLTKCSTHILETSHTYCKHTDVVHMLLWNCSGNFFLFFQTPKIKHALSTIMQNHLPLNIFPEKAPHDPSFMHQ